MQRRKRSSLFFSKNLVMRFLFLLVFLLTGGEVFAQMDKNVAIISGTVCDEQGEELVGANIVIAGTTQGVIADMDGKFQIKAAPGDMLLFSYIGMENKLVEVRRGNQTLNVKMTSVQTALNEVVVTGYQTLSKGRMTGSYTVVNGTALESKLQPNLTSVLEGQVAGLTVDQNKRVAIRGVSTLSASKQPLIVVDGFPIETSLSDSFFRYGDGTLENVNTDNVESITILKDGVAASIYGSRAANGVIVVTTKNGRKGKAKFSYRGTLSITQKPNLDNLQKASTNDYIDAEIDLYNLNPGASQYNILTGRGALSRVSYLLKQADLGQITSEQAHSEIDQLRNVNYLKQIEKYLYRPQLVNQHNFSVGGGSDNHSYNMAANYMSNRQNFTYAKNDRLTFDVKDEWKFNKFITLNTAVSLTYSSLETPYINPNPNYSTSTTSVGSQTLFDYYYSSYITPYTAIADKNGNALPLWGLSTYKQKTYEEYSGMKNTDYYLLDDISRNMIGTVDFQTRITGMFKINFMQGLNMEIGGNWQRGSYKYQQLQKADAFAVRVAFNDSKSKSNPVNHYLPEGAILNERRNINESWTFRSQINLNRHFGGTSDQTDHRVIGLVGMEARRSVLDNATLATRAGYNETAGSFVPINVLDYNSTVYGNDMLFGRNIAMNSGSYRYRDNRFVSWYGNASYEYKERYLATGSIRLDLTNFFGTDPKYRYKPMWSVGGTWKLSNEAFFNVKHINRLHLRSSYGINGNIVISQGPFLILGVGDYSSAANGVSYSISSPPNNQLRWEKTRTVNLGMDLSMFNNVLNINLDIYNKLSSDVLTRADVDLTTGFTALAKNGGKIQNRGIEVTIGATPVKTKNFRWDIAHNVGYNKNVVKKLNYENSYLSVGQGLTVEGYPIGSVWALNWAPLNETGNAMIYNKEGERVLSSTATLGDQVYMGSLQPNWDMSITNRFAYKNWEASIMWITKLGHVYYKDAFHSRNIQNRHVGERWKKPGDEQWAVYPALTITNADWWYAAYMDRNVGNASFAKLRDVTLAYKFNRDLIRKAGLETAKIYVQGRNLLTIKHKGTDIDPESHLPHLGNATTGSADYSMSTLPIPREFFIGLQVTF